MTENEKNELAALERLPALETACPECDGKGHWAKRGRCDECHGAGVVPTEFGKRVLNLIRHNRRTVFLDDG